jgi:outer membrane receptor protein involved in Fe transport
MRSKIMALAPMACALLLSLTLSKVTSAANADSAKSGTDEDVAEVVVTGSLIPQVRLEAPTPITVISGADIEARGFANLSEALQRSSFATGSVQGPQFNGGFTPGAQTLAVFGLSPSYMKYLTDGRPLADYPALYNGTDIIPSLNGIPTELVDHVDVLLGGQSSIYGSDAIAGVVNVIMKKKLDGPVVDARYGFTQDGGGTDRRLAAADTLSFASIDVTIGGQYERTDPIYAFQRNLTKTFFAQGTSRQTAARDFLLFGLFGDANGNTYYFEDPANCSNVSKLFGGSVAQHSRPGRGNYCGSTNTGYYTIGNGTESTQGYLHAADDFNEHAQLFTDVLVSHEVTKYTAGDGGGFFGTSGDSSTPFSYYEDPNLGDLLNAQRIFAPEEYGGMNNVLSKNTNNSVRATLGVKGLLTGSWTYSADVTYTENKLTERLHMLFTSKINAFFAPIYGPNLGFDPNLGANIYTPDYAAFYQPITPAQYQSFSGYVSSYSRTEESLFRAQLTSTSLFPLPGGDAGFAAVVEGGRQAWDYAPDPLYAAGETYLYTSTAGSGHRTRYAGTVEFRAPVLKTLTASASGRYDAYKVAEGTVDKATYNLGLEFRPIQPVLLRGRYGTAFKAPTLSDEYQGQSGFFQTLTDYYTCAVNGFTGSTLGNCPQAQQSYFGTTSGNPKLKPITAKVWDLGFVLTPLERTSISVDYIHWDISNEVIAQNADQLLRTESQCRLGTLDINSPTCVAAIAQVTRNSNGVLVSISTPKINQSREKLNVLTIGASYGVNAGLAGDFEFTLSYSDLLKHDVQRYAGDPLRSVYDDPINFQDFQSKENASLTWRLADFSSTFYVEHYGKSPNYLATINGYGTDGAGKLPTWTLCNLSLSYRKWSSLEVTAAVNNLFNRMPPVDHSYPGTEQQPYNTLNYNVFGRTYYLEASYKLHK